MAYLPVPSLQTGGMLWFTDLTAADPFYILPIAVTGTMFFILEVRRLLQLTSFVLFLVWNGNYRGDSFKFPQLGAESGIDNPNLRAMKTVFRIMPLVILPLTINFPTVSVTPLQFGLLCAPSWNHMTQEFFFLSCRLCSPTGWAPTSSHSVKWLCSDIPPSGRSSRSQKRSSTRPLPCPRMTGWSKAWRRVKGIKKWDRIDCVADHLSRDWVQKGFSVLPNLVFRLEERSTRPAAGRKRKKNKEPSGPRC